MSLHQHYKLELTFSGSLLTQAAGTMALGMDVEMQKDSQGQPVINGSLIKGNIRHTLEEFSELLADTQLSQIIDHWFGKETSDQQYTPQRTQIDFDFFWKLTTPYEKSLNQRTRIAIDSTTGTVKEGALQIVEDCFPLNNSSSPIFSGIITTRFSNNKDQKIFEKWVNKALEYIPAMGSFKGIGWGKLKSAKLKPCELNYANPERNSLPANTTRLGIQLELDRPFCIGRPRTPESNQIVSDDFIAGNVIKGLIARLYDNNEKLLEEKLCFNQLIMTHALPTDKNTNQRNLPIPLSLATFEIEEGKEKKVVDMAGLTQQAERILWEKAPTFSPDWKEQDKKSIAQALQQETSEPKRSLVLRTEINKKGISEEGKLFSLECIEPKNYYWSADIDLCLIDEEKRKTVLKELQDKLSNGFYGIGKTKAHAKLTFKLKAPYKAKTDQLTVGRQIVTLTTTARILPPDLSIQGTNSAKPLKESYQNYWRKVLTATVTLENYYAQQSLTSTYYHQLRNRQTEKAYYPEWLTDAGSVFILEINDAKALEKLQKYAETGLPAHSEADDTPANWKTTPYLPEQGYGEIQINNPNQLKLLYQHAEEEGK